MCSPKKQNDPDRTDNVRMTRQRRVILEELRRNNDHPTADLIYERVRRRLPRVSLGTIYRNLEVLSSLGEIQTLEMSGAQKRFDGIAQKHYHIRCIHCGSVDDAPIAPLSRLEDALYGSTVYTIICHRLEFVGLCPACSSIDSVRHRVEHNLNLNPTSEDTGA
jgi:Fe2+ or Zn2+ uptake regulation protein